MFKMHRTCKLQERWVIYRIKDIKTGVRRVRNEAHRDPQRNNKPIMAEKSEREDNSERERQQSRGGEKLVDRKPDTIEADRGSQ